MNHEYDEDAALFYDHYFSGVEGDVAFYVEVARHAGPSVLELGCGTGRILIPVAEAGVEVVGLDRSSPMLTIAREKLTRLPLDVQRRTELIEADMRDFELARRFSLVTIPYRAFLHNLSVEDQRRTLERVRAHLAGEGRLVLNVFDPRVDLLAAGHWRPPAGRSTEFEHPRSGHRVIVRADMRYDLERQLVSGEFRFEEISAANNIIASRRAPLTLRYVFRYEMEHLFTLSGFAVEALYGDFQRGPFRAGGEQIWVVRRDRT
jgi:SAM-dependent methyltransferase